MCIAFVFKDLKTGLETATREDFLRLPLMLK